MNDRLRTVVVTGGSRGIGRAVCLAFAGTDTRIFFTYQSNADAARETEARVAEAGGQAVGIAMDVAVEDQITAFFDEVMERTGRIDVLVNNAGVREDGLLVRMKTEQWDRVLDTNLKGTFLCIRQAAKPMMKQRYGRIVNISSIVGVTGNPGQANYVASKAGLIGLTKSIAQELASRGITANAVAPGFIETDMTASMPEKAQAAMCERIPMARPGEPGEVADAVVFLASDQAAYITGQVLHVSGGMFM